MSKQYKSQIRRRWELPADYWMLLERCCGLRTVWSNDTYEALELWGLDTLVKGQEGYAYNPVEQKVIKDWDEHLVVIASDAGDPYCLDMACSIAGISICLNSSSNNCSNRLFINITSHFRVILFSTRMSAPG